MKFTQGDYFRIFVWWGRNGTSDRQRLKFIKGNFPDGVNEQTFGCCLGFCYYSRVSHKGSEEGRTNHTWWVLQFFAIFGKKGNTWRMILEYNPTGHCFVIWDLVLIEIFQIDHNWDTE